MSRPVGAKGRPIRRWDSGGTKEKGDGRFGFTQVRLRPPVEREGWRLLDFPAERQAGVGAERIVEVLEGLEGGLELKELRGEGVGLGLAEGR